MTGQGIVRDIPSHDDNVVNATTPSDAPDSKNDNAPQVQVSLSTGSAGQNFCPEATAPEVAQPAKPVIFIRRPAVYLALCLAVLPLMAVTRAYSPAKNATTNAPGLWPTILQAVRDRATVDLTEDFGDDLQRWAGPSGLPENWSRDSAGSVRPGQLALYVKSIPLSDYRMEFRGLIDRKSLSFAYRAVDFDNYYAASLTVVNPGSIPEVALERYAVIDGKAGPRTQVRLPFSVRADTLYTVRVEVQGNRFATFVNDQFVDSFTDSRLPSGGVGFFSASDESARICWLRIVDRDDSLGKLCAFFTTRFDY
jgi:hypothetical protein